NPFGARIRPCSLLSSTPTAPLHLRSLSTAHWPWSRCRACCRRERPRGRAATEAAVAARIRSPSHWSPDPSESSSTAS
ncbi:hypothetical protein PFISCL1PPCAC_13148, partial [Pristionchus fissidentatus]